MHNPLLLALRPAMRSWVHSRTAGVDELPSTARLRSEGNDSDRLLVIGSGPGVGWGASSHDLALSGQLGRAISMATNRGTDIDVIAGSTMTAERAIGAVRALKLWRYDAIVVALGFADALDLVSLRQWERQISELIEYLSSESSSSTRLVFVGLPPVRSLPELDGSLGAVANRQARILDEVLRQACSGVPRAIFVSLDSDPGENYHRWASSLADTIVPMLYEGLNDPERDPRLDLGFDAELDRQNAVDERGMLVAGADRRFDEIVALAREIFGTDGAVFVIVDRDREVQFSNTGGDPVDMLRATSFCSITIQQRGAMIVPDTLLDPRFSSNPAVVGDPHVRFYAGFPIESVSGEPLGALCVFDRKPRARELVDEAALRSMALLIQGELQRATGPAAR